MSVLIASDEVEREGLRSKVRAAEKGYTAELSDQRSQSGYKLKARRSKLGRGQVLKDCLLGWDIVVGG